MFSPDRFEDPRRLLQSYHKFIKKITGPRRAKKVMVTLALEEEHEKEEHEASSSPSSTISIGTTAPEKVLIPYSGEIKLLGHEINLRPEAVLFLFSIDKTAKNLLLFCLATRTDPDTLQFSWNEKEKLDFQEFCALFGAPPQPSTIDDAMKTLVRENVVQNVKLKRYMWNPLVVACPEKRTAELFNTYTHRIMEKEQKSGTLGGLIQEKLFPRKPKAKTATRKT